MENSDLVRKFTAILFGLILVFVLVLVSMTFIKPTKNIQHTSTVIHQPVSKIWTSIADKSYYLNSKENLYKYNLDSNSPNLTWSEYFSPSDSIQGKVVYYNNGRNYHYMLIDRKHELVTGLKIKLDSLGPEKTKVNLEEQSIYINPYSSLYFKTFYPNTALDFEIVKINNTLAYIDSIKTTSTITKND